METIIVSVSTLLIGQCNLPKWVLSWLIQGFSEHTLNWPMQLYRLDDDDLLSRFSEHTLNWPMQRKGRKSLQKQIMFQ